MMLSNTMDRDVENTTRTMTAPALTPDFAAVSSSVWNVLLSNSFYSLVSYMQALEPKIFPGWDILAGSAQLTTPAAYLHCPTTYPHASPS